MYPNNRIKLLRQCFRITQKQLAEEINVSTKTINRWEKGTSQVTEINARDLALFFGVSIESIFSYNIGQIADIETTKPLPSSKISKYERNSGIFIHEFYGHIGVKLGKDNKTFWFPVTATESDFVKDQLSCEDLHVSFVTLNNYFVSLSISLIRSITFIEKNDPVLPINNDELSWDGNTGYSTEIYKALTALKYNKLSKFKCSPTFKDYLMNIVDKYNMTDRSNGILDSIDLPTLYYAPDDVVYLDIKNEPLFNLEHDLYLRADKMNLLIDNVCISKANIPMICLPRHRLIEDLNLALNFVNADCIFQ